ncbi:MlaC/ttg2D family ABC transporter substrate-binding protein [Neptunomonas qingdaonensis]|uniref:Phospholipid transport system substrate-binding protein n=1 Tax=Neptunomonas qingdaonensis TaxID=1045558 RepID=A0A1I2UH35_9GAMM|nr:ABC transporter substrate-binding protein [Neptunomonas qingdaonensis]SFG76472.1 phospholipid transport system substrate-binding protein [Neptunomonas qingdaonensis]
MQRFFVTVFLGLSLFLQSFMAAATWQEASVEVRQTIEDMIVVIDTHRAQQPVDITAVSTDIEKIVDRDVDFEYISKWVMGKYYRQASDDQRAKFAVVFKQTLIKTYAKSLLEFDIDAYKLVEPNAVSPEDDKQIVSVEVTSKAGVSYTLVNYMVKANGDWKLVNVMLDGINLRITFQNQFAEMMQRTQYDVGRVVDSWEAKVDDKPVQS